MTLRILPLFFTVFAPGFCFEALTQKAAAPAANVVVDYGWPRSLERDGVRVVYYQPQIDEGRTNAFSARGWPSSSHP